MADIVLINPRFDISFWGLELALPFMRKRAGMPPACLPLLAALTPAEHNVTLIDENADEIDFDRCARADIVGLTGMGIQRHRMREILAELKQRSCFTVVGGPMATVFEDYFAELADAIFIGEAEQTWPRFLEEWARGEHCSRYEQDTMSDMTRTPTPRFELLKMDRYLFGSLQFSRGCPFLCEFCDIIVTFGRKPRIKTSAQVLAEIEAIRAQGIQIAFIVDDNLIGNKRAIKPVLRDVIAWQERNGYPITFFTEASIDLADDPELMELMVAANIISVFIGIESPNEDSLRETKKFQNVRKGPSMIEKVHAIQDVGMEVWCGMIVGFDHDDESIFDAQVEFIRKARIVSALVGMLHAIPKTPLYDRLAADGRLDPDGETDFGTNVIPLRLSRESMRDGYVRVLRELYEPESYFGRLEDLFIDHRLDTGKARARYWRHHPWNAAKTNALFLAHALGLFLSMMHGIPEPSLRREYRRRVGRLLRARRDPGTLLIYLFKCAMHYHAHTMAKMFTGKRSRVISGY